jgi:hypothetical protein
MRELSLLECCCFSSVAYPSDQVGMRKAPMVRKKLCPVCSHWNFSIRVHGQQSCLLRKCCPLYQPATPAGLLSLCLVYFTCVVFVNCGSSPCNDVMTNEILLSHKRNPVPNCQIHIIQVVGLQHSTCPFLLLLC